MSRGERPNDGDGSEYSHTALHTIGLLFEPGDIIEIRALNVDRKADYAGSTCAGYFNFENEKALSAAISRLDGRSEGVYVVLNRFNPALLARATNRLLMKLKNTTSDADIVLRRWLYIDADAVRPGGISATNREHEAALQRTAEIREYLQSQGWPEPIMADSGNGGHLLYRLPPLDLHRAGELVKVCLEALASRFSDESVKVDKSTASAARLCKLYGTWARKGDSTPDRPHRLSHILSEPDSIAVVGVEALEALAKQVEVKMPRSQRQAKCAPNATGKFDVGAWISAVGLKTIRGPERYLEDARKWTLQFCPFNPEHKAPVIIEMASGAIIYKCLHKSCEQNNWRALRELVSPGHEVTTTATPADQEASRGSVPTITDLSQVPSVWTMESQITWCVDEMIAQGSITLISAESGTGKTWLAYYIAGCVAHGLPVLNRAVLASKVLYLDGENPLYLVKQRLFDLGIESTPDLVVWGGWNAVPPPGPQSEIVQKFAREQRGLIVFDSLIEFHTGSEQSSTETRAFMRQLRALANLGATVVVLHNVGKAETSKLYRGSSDIKAAVDTAYLLRAAEPQTEKLGKLQMTCFKGRLAPGQHFAMNFQQKQGFLSCEYERVRGVQEIISEILRDNPRVNQSKIVKMVRGRECTKRQVEECLRNGNWKREPGPRNSTLYSLPAEDSD